MDYCEEGDLKLFIKTHYINRKMPEEHARCVIKQIVEGLKAFAQNNIVHRDLKIENILVKRKLSLQNPEEAIFSIENYEFKIGDLGLAKAVGSKYDWI